MGDIAYNFGYILGQVTSYALLALLVWGLHKHGEKRKESARKAKETMLVKMILVNDWVDVRVMAPQAAPTILLDILFMTKDGGVRLTGKSHPLLNVPEEAFSLAINEPAHKGQRNDVNTDLDAWGSRTLIEEWVSQSISSMSTIPRTVRFYSDPRLRGRKLPAKGFFDDCTAIEFIKEEVGGDVKRIVFAASEKYPCAIEMGKTSDECAALLNGLEQMALEIA